MQEGCGDAGLKEEELESLGRQSSSNGAGAGPPPTSLEDEWPALDSAFPPLSSQATRQVGLIAFSHNRPVPCRTCGTLSSPAVLWRGCALVSLRIVPWKVR